MAITPYLAMTAAEITFADPLPARIAWMACHFSPYSTGLSNLPESLPKGSLLILNDRTPVRGHDPALILEALESTVNALDCAGVLLDFEQKDCAELFALSCRIMDELHCPRAVSLPYAREKDWVFLPPVPEDIPVETYLRSWKGRTLWLECSAKGKTIMLTNDGAREQSSIDYPPVPPGQEAPSLHCHYTITEQADSICFRLSRTQQDLTDILEAAEHLGVTAAVGLYQELGSIK